MSTESPDQPQQPGGPTPPPPPPSGGQPGPGTPPPPPPGPGGYQQPGGYQAAPPPAYGAPGAAQPLSDSDQRMWAMLAHLGGIIFSFLAPLVIWLVFRERGRFVDEQAKEALNFQITLVIAAIGISIISVITLGLGAFLYLAFLVALVFMILAGVAANRGEAYRYPVNIRLIK